MWKRKTPDNKALIHHLDRGSQYLTIKYTVRLIEVGIDPSGGTVGDSYDNALAECVIRSGACTVLSGATVPCIFSKPRS